MTCEDPDAERSLVARLRAGDAEALRTVVERYQHRVFALVYGIVRDAHEVEDIAQEVFHKVYTRIHAFDERSRLYTWIYRVAANAAKDHVKKRSRRPAQPLDEDAPIRDAADGPGVEAARSETQRKVREAIAELPPHYRAVLAMREIEGMTYSEIARALGLSAGTVESRLHRARSRLRRRLETHAR